jgi:streptomycin 6-kinase
VFEFPVALLRYVQNHDDAGAPRRGWMTALPRVLDEVRRRWSLNVGRPFQPGGCASWVAPARDAAGTPLVLKLGWRHYEAEHEADGLRVWGGGGTVRLVDSLELTDTSALLLEACEPGTHLSQVLPADEQDVVVAGLLRRLWMESAPGHPFRPLTSMCEQWSAEFEQEYAGCDPRRRLDGGLAQAGIELCRSLPATAQSTVLLHTDLHPENVLAAGREPWLGIDPKPYLGDPAYDVLQHMLNFPDRLSADPVGFALRMAQLLDLDRTRVRHWLFARCVQESVDRPDLGAVAMALAP